MNCQEFWNAIPELGDVAGNSHLRECPACAARMSRHRELEAGLRAVAAGFRRVEAPPRVEARLRTAFRRQTGSEHRESSRRWIPAFTWVAAFAAMIALAAFLVRDRKPEEAVRPPAQRIGVSGGDRALDLGHPVSRIGTAGPGPAGQVDTEQHHGAGQRVRRDRLGGGQRRPDLVPGRRLERVVVQRADQPIDQATEQPLQPAPVDPGGTGLDDPARPGADELVAVGRRTGRCSTPLWHS